MFYKDLDYVEKRVLELESEVTKICLEGTGLVPKDVNAYWRLNDIRKELEDLTDGENTLLFNGLGMPEPQYVVRPKNGSDRFDYWSDELTGASSAGHMLLPCFVRKNKKRDRFYVSKFKMSAIYTDTNTHTNYPVGLLGLAPAHSSGGFAVSYQEATKKLIEVNGSTPPSYMPDKMVADFVKKRHLISWDEYAYLCLLSKEWAWQPYGNANRGKDIVGNIGDTCGYAENNTVNGESRWRHNHTTLGSGGRTWRHNGKFTGIADLVGNVYTIILGAQIDLGVPKLIDFSITDERDLTWDDLNTTESTLWKTISSVDGAYLDPAQEEIAPYMIDFKDDPTGKTGELTPVISNAQLYSSTLNLNAINKDITFRDGVSSHWKLEMMGIAPFKNGGLDGKMWFNIKSANRACFTGGHWHSGGNGGLRFLRGDAGTAGSAHYGLGALSASCD